MKKKTTKTSRTKNTTARKNGSRSGSKNGSQNGDGESGRLKELLLHELKDIYWAEKHLVKTLPKMENAASSMELKNAFSEHTSVTEKQVERLEEVFSLLGEKPFAKKCEGMKGLTDEGDEIKAETDKNSMTRDAGLIISAQKVEHYEIAAYGSLAQLSRTLGLSEVAALFEETLQEEKETDEKLTDIAESSIHVEAEQER